MKKIPPFKSGSKKQPPFVGLIITDGCKVFLLDRGKWVYLRIATTEDFRRIPQD